MTQTVPAASPAIVGGDDVVLEARNLSKRFSVGTAFKPRFVHALTDASFTIRRRQVVALVGESGSGKSTTARLLVRLMEPTSGQILLHGRDVLAEERRQASLAYRKSVQMIFQDPFGSLNPLKTIGYAVERPILRHGVASGAQAAEDRVHDLLETVGLSPAADVAARFPYQLSGGQRQRVAIARALGVEPEIILADEPISMLDVSIRMGVLNLLERLKDERGIGFLYITHDLASARYIGDRTIVMYAGHQVESADSTELMDAPAHPYTKLLLSAVPDPQSKLKLNTDAVRGEIPSLVDPPPGCPFAKRCPAVMDVCRSTMPERTYLTAPGTPDTKEHWVRCHLHGAGGQPAPALAPAADASEPTP